MTPRTNPAWTAALWLMRLACVLVFVGRGWQHLFWDAPYRAVLWDEGLMKGLIEALTPMTWTQWATSDAVDSGIETMIRVIGGFYLLCAIAAVRVTRETRFEKAMLIAGSISLTILAGLYYKEKFLAVGQFFEYAIQFGSPAILAWMVSRDEDASLARLFVALKVVCGLTFVCHGLYAIGYYVVPGDFLDMTMAILRCDDVVARLFLKVVGAIDVVLGLMLFFERWTPAAHAYSVFWGLATAFARVLANVSWVSFGSDLHQWAPETIMRLPHGVVPLAALVLTVPALVTMWPSFRYLAARPSSVRFQ